MLFWIFMLLFVLMIPLTMIYFGRRFFKSPPKSINATFGYRSTMSMKNQETWKLAHTVCGRFWFRCGRILLPLVRFTTGMSIVTFLKGIFEPWLVAFTTCSSAAALPANLNAARKLGSTKAISSFSIPLGNTINMNGTAIYMGVCSIFAAEVYGLPLTMADQLTIVLMGVLAAVGTAGVPGAGLIMTTIIFTQVGIPLEAVALIAGVDRILDMIRTSINVVGDVAAAVVVTKMEGDLNSEPYVEGAD